jgi:hypothetical protein
MKAFGLTRADLESQHKSAARHEEAMEE